MNKNALTVLELMIVIVIIGILAAIAIPNYTNWVERTRGERAIANIELMVSAAKQYAIKNNAPPAIPLYGLPAINAALNLELSDTNFNYSVTLVSEYVQIRAERNGLFIIYNLDPMDGDPDGWDTTNSTWPWMP